MELPIQPLLKIGQGFVGLLGLDLALARALADQKSSRAEIVDQLYRQIVKQNYIPPGSAELYRQALDREYQRLKSGLPRQEKELLIRILGPACVSCSRLQELVFAVVSELAIAADIVWVQDPDEIGRFGLIRTPALIVDNKTLCSGRLPSRFQIETWLRAAAANLAGAEDKKP